MQKVGNVYQLNRIFFDVSYIVNYFDKSRRLLRKSDYDTVFNQAKKIVTSEFIILYRPNGLEHARLGLALSKRIVHKAHDRNRLKRLLRETFRMIQLPAVDLVVLARRDVDKIENQKLIAKLSGTWNKLIALYAA